MAANRRLQRNQGAAAWPPRARRGAGRAVARMVEHDRYCLDVLTQISAAQAALEKVALGLLSLWPAHPLFARHLYRSSCAAATAAKARRTSEHRSSPSHALVPTPDGSGCGYAGNDSDVTVQTWHRRTHLCSPTAVTDTGFCAESWKPLAERRRGHSGRMARYTVERATPHGSPRSTSVAPGRSRSASTSDESSDHEHGLNGSSSSG